MHKSILIMHDMYIFICKSEWANTFDKFKQKKKEGNNNNNDNNKLYNL